MKKNELFTTVVNVADCSHGINKAQEKVKADKALARKNADLIINHFVENDFMELPTFLTDTFKTMKAAGLFGNLEGNKVGSMAQRQNNAAKFFQRSLEALENGYTLKGYNPFQLTEKVIEADKSPEKKLIELCEKLSIDKVGQNNMLAEYKASMSRAKARQKAMERDIKKIAEKKAEEKATINMNEAKKLMTGLTNEQKAELLSTENLA